MKIIERQSLEKQALPGRVLQHAIGIDAFEASTKMTVGFASHIASCGPALPHCHAEECVYILDAKYARIRFGPMQHLLDKTLQLENGQLLHIAEGEWHVFEYDEGGHCDVMFFYAQTDNLRPEDGK